MDKYNIHKSFVEIVRQHGVKQCASLSGKHRRVIEEWIYNDASPHLDNAIDVLNAIGYTLNIQCVDELKAEIKAFGSTKLSKKSGVSLRTIRSYLYEGIMPTLNKTEQIMQAIGKPLKIVKAINKVWAGCLYRKCAQVDADTVIRFDDREVYVKAIDKPLYEDKQ